MADDFKNTARALGVRLGGRPAKASRSPFLPDDLPAALAKGAKPVRKQIHTVSDAASEHQIQCAVARYLDLALDGVPNCIWWAVPNGGTFASRIDSNGKRVSVAAAKAKREGLRPGVSDIMILWGGRLICIELKTAKGRQSPEQKQWADSATCAGAAYYVARSVEQVEQFLDAAGLPLRARTKSAVGRASAE
jgi:hypothetical protein